MSFLKSPKPPAMPAPPPSIKVEPETIASYDLDAKRKLARANSRRESRILPLGPLRTMNNNTNLGVISPVLKDTLG